MTRSRSSYGVLFDLFIICCRCEGECTLNRCCLYFLNNTHLWWGLVYVELHHSSAVQAVISFLHGLAFPSLWSGSAQHLLSPAWQLSLKADRRSQIEQQHSFFVIGSICPFTLAGRWCSSPVRGCMVQHFLEWQSMTPELLSWSWFHEMHSGVKILKLRLVLKTLTSMFDHSSCRSHNR